MIDYLMNHKSCFLQLDKYLMVFSGEEIFSIKNNYLSKRTELSFENKAMGAFQRKMAIKTTFVNFLIIFNWKLSYMISKLYFNHSNDKLQSFNKKS